MARAASMRPVRGGECDEVAATVRYSLVAFASLRTKGHRTRPPSVSRSDGVTYIRIGSAESLDCQAGDFGCYFECLKRPFGSMGTHSLHSQGADQSGLPSLVDKTSEASDRGRVSPASAGLSGSGLGFPPQSDVYRKRIRRKRPALTVGLPCRRHLQRFAHYLVAKRLQNGNLD